MNGKLTAQDLAAATGLFAAAADKTITLTPDAVAYMNAILGINTVKTGDVTYSSLDYSSYTYDRSDKYNGDMLTILVKQDDGTYVPTSVNLYDAVFNGVDYTQTGFDAFSTAINDARMIISFIHDNAAPE